MRPDALAARVRTWDVWARWAVGVWLAVIVGVCGYRLVKPVGHSLYPTYERAGAAWLKGTPLYRPATEPGIDQFRYSPVVATALVPFHLLPVRLGNVLWRLLNAGVFLAGFAWFLHAAVPVIRSRRQQALMYLLLVPLALSSLHNAQPNPLLIGLLLVALAAAAQERWTLAAFCVAGAAALKIYPLALGLLLVAVYPRKLGLRLVLALAVMIGLPFLCQRPGYVAEQYAALYALLKTGDESRRYWPLHMAYRDLWLLLRVAHLPISTHAYLLVQMGSGAGCALLCVAGRLRGWDRRQVLLAVLALGTCWMMLCGPATEACTFVVLAPALAWAVVDARRAPWPSLVRWLPALALVLLLSGVLAGGISQKVAHAVHSAGVQPLAALLLLLGYALVLGQDLRRRDAVRLPRNGAAPPRAA